MRKPSGLVSAALLLALALAGCSTSAATSAGGATGTVKLGLLSSVTGAYAPIGQGEVGAMKVAVGQINDAGGFKVAGTTYKLQFVQENAASDPGTAHAEAVTLVRNDGVKFLFGPSETPGALAVQPLVSQAGVLWFTSSLGVANGLSQGGGSNPLNKYAYSMTMPTNEVGTTAVAGLVKLSPALKSVAIVWPSQASYDPEVNSLTSALQQAGLTVVATKRFDPSTTDFTPILTSIRPKAPDVVLAGASSVEVGAIEQQMASLGFAKTTLFGFGATSQLAFLPSGAPAPFPVIYPTNGAADIHVDQPAVTKLFGDYQKYNGQPAPTDTPFWTLNIPVVHALVAAMQKAGTVSDITKIQAALLQVHLNAGTGNFRYLANHLPTVANTVCIAVAGKIRCVVVPQGA